MKKIDIVIVNWNAGSFLKECVESLTEYGGDVLGDTIVVDNASNDNSIKFMEGLPYVKLILNPENFGFAKACNIGAKVCNGEYILFLNPDAQIYENTLNSCLNFMNNPNNSSIGILGIPLEDSNGVVSRTCARFPSVLNMISCSTGLEKIFPTSGVFMKEWDHMSTREVDQVIGAFFLVRRNVYIKLNGFDERFFVYLEEVDFSYRAKKEGFASIYFSGARALHYGGVSSSKSIKNRIFFRLRSRIQYYHKHFNLASALLVIFITLFIDFPVRMAHAIFIKHSYVLTAETAKGYYMFVVALFKLYLVRGND